MCELIPLKLADGTSINVSEYKISKLKRYLEIFPLIKSVDKVILFASALESRCREDSDIDFLFFYNDRKQFHHDMSYVLPNYFPESCYDDKLRFPTGSTSMSGAFADAQTKGVVIYKTPMKP
ncbi:hypothetical protein [Clostridium sp. AF32-12BH]|uniref:hypothetical protein n=1 Tax=Clostridium sp. AF32-12BH TaxID=2292006 RepID=UPI000E510AEA|nr:hypothetical protein [Clostridium sp. AF32-12BH]RHP44096.1 hypothetical protein DWZ40_15080 [Clostridium sp. AF32-12BH]